MDNPGSGFIISGKPIGIWLSHYMCWSAALTRRDEPHISIMEDDAVLPKDWQALIGQALIDVPQDFDMLYLGSCACMGHSVTRVKGDVFQMEESGPQCLHSYVVARKALPIMLDTQRKIYAPIDISLLLHTHPLLKVYVVLPSIVGQRDTVLVP